MLAVDALASSHPLSSKEEYVMMPEDISALFDSITYDKVQYHLQQNQTIVAQCVVFFKSQESRY